MERALPVYTVEGTDFLVDVEKMELREKANPENTISLFDMRDMGDRYQFEYDRKGKNMPALVGHRDSTYVSIPQLVELDPDGMAQKYGYTTQQIQGKTDFDLMVDQEALKERMTGRLPTMDILGHTFYVDLRMDMLRPKDDFLSEGIVFSKIDYLFDEEKQAYLIPYNPQTHAFRELDSSRLTEIPKDIVLISFPSERELDPISWNRKNGFDETFGLKETNIKSHFVAKLVEWKDVGIEEIIKENIMRQQQQKKQSHQPDTTKKAGEQRKKGPRL